MSVTPLTGKYVLLTGTSRGIGPIIADALARHGANIALTARSEEKLHTVAESLKGYGTGIIVVPADLSNAVQRQDLVRTVLDRFGSIDILINNAGVEMEGAFLGLPREKIREAVEVNLVAPIELTHLVLPLMVNRSEGHIINISSLSAKRGAPFDAIYSGAKAGLAEWACALRLELADTGISCSTIFPGYVTDVGMFAKFGVAPPWTIGSCTPAQVAQAVIRAVKTKQVEIIVNSRPVRLLIAVGELFPALGDRLMHWMGIVKFQQRKLSGPE